MKPTHLLIILTDDQGRCDYSACGTKDICTPNIDGLFRQGAGFENFFANSPVCSPSRAALLTGCYPDRVGVPGVIRTHDENSWGFLDNRVPLLPALLKPAGYHSALIGKWHLGLASPNLPRERGFDFFHGFLGDMMDDYITHLRHGENYMRENEQVITPEGHATDLFTTWACKYLEERAREDRPFFLYLAYNAPHDPIQPRADWLEKVKTREPLMNPARQKLVALIEHLDDGIGKVLSTLKRLGLEENTMVCFLSDNGGVLANGANNGPWRSEKGHMYDGGLRVPCAVRWPGQIRAGGKVEEVALTMDLFTTALAATGVQAGREVDGVDLLPLLRGEQRALAPREHYFVRREGDGYGGKTIEALRSGDYKILQDSPFAPLELYDMAKDPRERENLAPREPQVFHRLWKRLRAHIQRGGQTPWFP